ncbi:hypothetical protein Taro_010415 [Colocasia esculenta]|uniref:Uncharacterized protein n=1 Tax=Colocasia esculenta TaxID=4460 RepID=A0A843U3K1_COLES|nr:hypothetical protein [Colocasia esculenta]
MLVRIATGSGQIATGPEKGRDKAVCSGGLNATEGTVAFKMRQERCRDGLENATYRAVAFSAAAGCVSGRGDGAVVVVPVASSGSPSQLYVTLGPFRVFGSVGGDRENRVLGMGRGSGSRGRYRYHHDFQRPHSLTVYFSSRLCEAFWDQNELCSGDPWRWWWKPLISDDDLFFFALLRDLAFRVLQIQIYIQEMTLVNFKCVCISESPLLFPFLNVFDTLVQCRWDHPILMEPSFLVVCAARDPREDDVRSMDVPVTWSFWRSSGSSAGRETPLL